jgi:hypothetical protein
LELTTSLAQLAPCITAKAGTEFDTGPCGQSWKRRATDIPWCTVDGTKLAIAYSVAGGAVDGSDLPVTNSTTWSAIDCSDLPVTNSATRSPINAPNLSVADASTAAAGPGKLHRAWRSAWNRTARAA